MSQSKSTTGHCLCGKIKIHAKQMNPALSACHCGMCRKWSAGPYFAVDCGTDVNIDGQEHLGIYHSSEWGDRAFCKHCGTTLFYHLKPTNHYYVSAELFDDKTLIFTQQIFIEDKPDYYEFANHTRKMTAEDVMAAYS